MFSAFLSCFSSAQAPNLAHRVAQNKPGQIKQAIEALRAGFCPAARRGGYVYLKTIIPRRRSENADSLKNILLEIRFTDRKARIVSASGPPIVPSIHEGEKPMFFPSRALPFPFPPLRRAVFARFYF